MARHVTETERVLRRRRPTGLSLAGRSAIPKKLACLNARSWPKADPNFSGFWGS